VDTIPIRTIIKIPPELRKRKIDFSKEPMWYRRILWRLKDDSQFLRSTIQLSFMLLCVWIGIEFFLFMRWGQAGGTLPYYQRPPGVEGFLPISALMSLMYWIETGVMNTIHPSGLFILLTIIVLALLLKKSFCGWLCPVGTLSESLWMFGQRLMKNNLRVSKWFDSPLRSLKYLLLFYFVYSIAQMDISALENFIYSPYNKVADIKMYLFFADITTVALWTILALVAASIFIKNFWCRYLCPYGALLGCISWFSPFKVTRKTATCIDCELCTKVCPSSIQVHTKTRIWSDECMSVYACSEAVPVTDTLVMGTGTKGRAVPAWVFGTLIAGIFIAMTGLAMLTGYWQNTISRDEYLKRIQNIESPLYYHYRGQVPEYGPQD